MHLTLVTTTCSIVGWKIARRTSLTSPTVETIFSRYGGQMAIVVDSMPANQITGVNQ